MFDPERQSTDRLDWAAIASQVRRLTRRHARPEEAEDIAQEVMLRLWRGRARVGAARDQRAWVATLALNEVRRARAGRRPDHAPLDGDEGLPALGQAEVGPAAIDRLDVLELLRDLERTDQELVLLHYFGDLSLAEISRWREVPLGTVKARLHRARTRLRASGQAPAHRSLQAR